MTLKIAFSSCLLFFVVSLFAQHDPICINDQIQLDERRLRPEPHHSTGNSFGRSSLYLNTVVHVLYYDEEDDISDETIELVIDNLNRLFRAEGVDLSRVHPAHRDKLMESQIQFCLTKTAPDGLATTGITHTKTSIEGFDGHLGLGTVPVIEDVKTQSLGGVNPWDIDRYFNIWIAQIGDETRNSNYGIPRIDYFPLNGLVPEDFIPGVVIDLDNFLSPPTFRSLEGLLAHECGHAFGLMHTSTLDLNSPDPLCGGSDFMDDTPTAKSTVFCDPSMDINTCIDSLNDEVDHVANFMNGACKLMFTPNQIAAMQNNLTFAPSELFYNAACETISFIEANQLNSNIEFTIVPNPNNGNFAIHFSQWPKLKGRLLIYDAMGQIVLEKNIDYNNTPVSQIECDRLVNGLYYLIIKSKQGTISKKMVLQ